MTGIGMDFEMGGQARNVPKEGRLKLVVNKEPVAPIIEKVTEPISPADLYDDQMEELNQLREELREAGWLKRRSIKARIAELSRATSGGLVLMDAQTPPKKSEVKDFITKHLTPKKAVAERQARGAEEERQRLALLEKIKAAMGIPEADTMQPEILPQVEPLVDLKEKEITLLAEIAKYKTQKNLDEAKLDTMYAQLKSTREKIREITGEKKGGIRPAPVVGETPLENVALQSEGLTPEEERELEELEKELARRGLK